MISFRKQGKETRAGRASRATTDTALEGVLRMFADPVRRRLKVRTALRAGGIYINHNGRLLVVGAGVR